MISNSTVEIPVQNLQIGMYVSDLDCPWLETPYLIQGLLIQSRNDVEKLQHHCTHVYVDVDRSEPFVIQKHIPHSLLKISSGYIKQKQDNELSTLDPLLHRVKTYDDIRTAEQEIPSAQKAYNFILTLLDDVNSNIERNIKFDTRAALEVVETLCESVIRNPDAALLLAQLKTTGKELYDNAVKASVHMLAFGRHLGLPRRELIVLGLGGLLMDIGKQRLPKEIQTKSSLSLKPNECKQMKQHIAYGVEIVTQLSDASDEVIKIVTQHHERENGNGYPQGLHANQIHPYSRMAVIVDCYQELMGGQPGMPGLRAFEAFKELRGNGQSGLNFALVEQFAQCIGVFPIGSLVELNTGEVAIVLTHNRTQRFFPRIMIICDIKKNPYDAPITVDLRKTVLSPTGIAYAIAKDLPQGAFGIDAKKYYL